MSDQALMTQPVNIDPVLMEQVLLGGDLSKLKPAERIAYYKAVCDSLKLNPLTKPFDYLSLNNKLTLYVKKDCTDQLRSVHSVSCSIGQPYIMDGVLFIKATASLPNGRTDESLGAVNINNLSGEARANAFLKAETKARRRVTLSICGLGMIDQSEVSSVRGARVVSADEAHTTQTPAGRVASEEPKPKLLEDPVENAVAEFRSADKFGRLKQFQDKKQQLQHLTGDDRCYYGILNDEAKAEKSDKIQTLGLAIAAYRKMCATILELENPVIDEKRVDVVLEDDTDAPF